MPPNRATRSVRRTRPLPDKTIGADHFAVTTDPWEITRAWRMVYHAYRRRGLIDPNPHRIYTIPRIVRPGTAVIVGKDDAGVTCSMTAYQDGPNDLPMDDICPMPMAGLRRLGCHLMEIGLFAHRRTGARQSLPTVLRLMRHAFFYALDAHASDIVIGVHPRHAPFYTRYFGFQPFAKATGCPRVKGHPMTPLRADIQAQLQRNPVLRNLRCLRAESPPPHASRSRRHLTFSLFQGTPVEAYLRSHAPADQSTSRAQPANASTHCATLV